MNRFLTMILVGIALGRAGVCNAQNYQQLAQSYFDQGKYEECIKQCKFYYAETGATLYSLQTKASQCIEYIRNGDKALTNPSEAEQYYRMALTLNPNDANVRRKLHDILSWIGQCYVIYVDDSIRLAVQKNPNQAATTRDFAMSISYSSNMGNVEWLLASSSDMKLIFAHLESSVFCYDNYWASDVGAAATATTTIEIIEYQDRYGRIIDSRSTARETKRESKDIYFYFNRYGEQKDTSASSFIANYFIVRRFNIKEPSKTLYPPVNAEVRSGQDVEVVVYK